MANLTYSSELLDDILWRADELTDGTSDFESQALSYLNRAYRALWMGGTEFDPTINEEWWWLQSRGTLVLQPTNTSGTVAVTNNSAAVVFSEAKTFDLTSGWYLKVTGETDVYRFSAQDANQSNATLDSVFTGDTDTGASFTLFKLEYDLGGDVLRLNDKMHASRDARYDIYGMDLSKMDEEFPIHLIEAGTPSRFAMVDEDTVKFNRYGSADGNYIRVDYSYTKKPADLTDDAAEEPLVPLQYRHLLSDMAVFFIHQDKENDRAATTYEMARRGLKAMKNENKARWAKMGRVGHIYARPITKDRGGILRTESGIIIG